MTVAASCFLSLSIFTTFALENARIADEYIIKTFTAQVEKNKEAQRKHWNNKNEYGYCCQGSEEWAKKKNLPAKEANISFHAERYKMFKENHVYEHCAQFAKNGAFNADIIKSSLCLETYDPADDDKRESKNSGQQQ